LFLKQSWLVYFSQTRVILGFYNKTFISNYWVKAIKALFLLLGAIFSNNNYKQLPIIIPIKFFVNYFKLLFKSQRYPQGVFSVFS